MSEPGAQLGPDELFRMYPQLAARVTNLRAILQNPESITRTNVQAWAEDYKSVLRDMMELATQTADYLQRNMPEVRDDKTLIP